MAGRGIDFEHRFRTSRWAEDLLLRSIGEKQGLLAVRFGLSRIRKASEVKYDREAPKEPDLLVYEVNILSTSERRFLSGRDLSEENREKFQPRGELAFVTAKASAAIEVEFSPYRASEMSGRNWRPRTSEQWERRPLKNATPPTAPNIWVKEEDLGRLNQWESTFGVPIVIAHLFDQEAFAIPLSVINNFNKRYSRSGCDKVRLQMTTGIFKKEQSYDRLDAQGARERKMVFIVTPGVAVKVGDVAGVRIEAQLGVSSSKKYVTHSLFSNGHLAPSPEFVAVLKGAKGQQSCTTNPANRIAEGPHELSLWPASDDPPE
jgi:hypothetical protein